MSGSYATDVRSGIIECMKYVYRVRRLVKIVYDEANESSELNLGSDSHPTVIHCQALFAALSEKYDNKVIRATFAIATGDEYLGYAPSRDSEHPHQRVFIKSAGVKLLTSKMYFMNELADVIGKIAPITISLLALVTSIILPLLLSGKIKINF